MEFSKHLSLVMICTIAWVIFVVLGWPSYYQAWPFTNLLYYLILVYFVLGFIIYRMINKYEGNKFVRSFWVSFYICFLIMFYDYIYITFCRGGTL